MRICNLFYDMPLMKAGKDMFLTSYYLGKELNASVCCVYSKDNSHNWDRFYRGVEMIGIKSHTNFYSTPWTEKEHAWWLIKNARKIDVLCLFWINPRNLIFSKIYKILNPKGFVYIKGDASGIPQYNASDNGLKKKLKKFLYNSVDLISIETKEIYHGILQKNELLKDKCVFMTNGFDDLMAEELNINPPSFQQKENLIITVGRIGHPEKNNEMLLEALTNIDLKDWKVAFIGPIEKDFAEYVEKVFFKKHPALKANIIFTGNISEKKELYGWYSKAKIFVLTSPKEGFANVFTEALFFGDYIITTPVLSSDEITKDGTIGEITPFNDSTELGNRLQRLIDNQEILESNHKKAIELCKNRFIWSNLIKTVAAKINQ